MNNEITLFSNFGLATPSSITFSESMNAFVTTAQMFASGNAYGNAARFVNGLLIKEDIGYGQPWTFLNGLHIYDLKTRKLLAEKVFPMYKGAFYSKDTVKHISQALLTDLIVSAADEQGYDVDEKEVSNKIYTMLDRAFSANQLQEMGNNIKAIGF